MTTREPLVESIHADASAQLVYIGGFYIPHSRGIHLDGQTSVG